MARKPLGEASVAGNVLQYGTGGIQIDACRVSASTARSGRYPANLFWVHHSECVFRGVVEEKGYAINRYTDGMKPFGGSAGHQYQGTVTNALSVPVWDCYTDCAVHRMDVSVGELKSGTNLPSYKRYVPRLGQSGIYGVDSGKGATGGRVFQGDKGTASRFFKTFSRK